MTTPGKRSFASRLGRYLCELFRQAYHAVLLAFVHLVGRLTQPGQWPSGPVQTWCLRRMGVRCSSRKLWIGPRVALDNPDRLILGTRVMIGPDSRLTGHRADIVIGDDFLGAPGLFINTGTHDLATLEPKYAPVVIGKNVWCGTRVTICTGVEIGDGCTIGAGSVVVQNLPAHHVGVGVPCRPVRESRRSAQTWSNFRGD